MFTCMETESFDAVTERRTRKRAGRCGGSSPQVRDRRPPISARDSNAQRSALRWGRGEGYSYSNFHFLETTDAGHGAVLRGHGAVLRGHALPGGG